MNGLQALQHPAADKQEKKCGQREQLAIHSADADPHGPFRICGDDTCRQASPHIACSLPGSQKGNNDHHNLPKDRAAIQIVEQFGEQTSDFRLIFHSFSPKAWGILRHLPLPPSATACSRCCCQFAKNAPVRSGLPRITRTFSALRYCAANVKLKLPVTRTGCLAFWSMMITLL